MPPRKPNENCERHEAWLKNHEERIRDVEIQQAKGGVKLALIAAGASLIGSLVIAVIAGVLVYYVTRG